jgi:2-polyprenyl-3-methyl-5-hydroxy-6-metoxy-1,4-benzoquinol methylase
MSTLVAKLRKLPQKYKKIVFKLVPERAYLQWHRIDPGRFRAIQDNYGVSTGPIGRTKYLSFKHRYQRRLRSAYDLGLHQSKGTDVLDIGTGPGYFPYICGKLGHNAYSLDLGDDPIFNDLIELLGVRRIVWAVNKFERLPDQGTKFDTITAFLICFNGHNSSDLWGQDEWAFFLKDLVENQLKPNGRIFLNLNVDDNTKRPYTDELRDFFLATGAEVNGRDVLYRWPNDDLSKLVQSD